MTTTTSSAEAQATIDTARAMAPRIAEQATTIEKQGALPSDLVDEMRSAGFFHLVVPRLAGGLELDPVSAARVVEELAVGDGSAGWCAMIAAQNGAFAGFVKPDAVPRVWGNGGIVAGTANPIGRATPVDKPEPGYVVSGRWSFASGSSHATWFAGECVVYNGEERAKDANGEEILRLVFVPRDQTTIYQTWDTTGLRGTASNDFSFTDAFVPADLAVEMAPNPELPLHRALPLVFINHGAQALGVARGAIDNAIEIASKKHGWGNVPINETSRVQSAIAEASVLVESAAEHMYGAASRLWEQALVGETDARLRAQVRLATSNAANASVQAVDAVHTALGTSAIFAANPLERRFRDIHTAAKHVMIGHMTYEAGGRVLLGKDADFPFF